MGYELNRLMQQYGVSTPGMMNAPTAPVAPTAPAPLAEGADDAAKKRHADATAAYNAAVAAQPAAMETYRTNLAAYQPYAQEYQRRMRETPMYLQQQFAGPTTATVPPAMTFSPAQMSALSPTGIGMDAMQRNIQNYFRANPNATPEQIAAAQQQWGVSDRDIRNAMGPGFSYGQGMSGYGSTGLNYATAPGGIGKDKYYSNIRDWIAAHPNASYADILAEADKWGVNNRDLYTATGSYWGNQLRSPVFTVPAPAPTSTAAPGAVPSAAPVAAPAETPASPDIGGGIGAGGGTVGDVGGGAGGSIADIAPGGQGANANLASLGLGLMAYGDKAFGLLPGATLANIAGSYLAGREIDSAGRAAQALSDMSSVPGITTISDRSGNVYGVSSPASIAAADAAIFGTSLSAAQEAAAQAMADYAESGAAGAGMAGGNDGSMGVGSGSADLMAKGGLAKIKRFQAGGVNREDVNSEAWMRMAPLKESEPVEAEPVGISLPSVPQSVEVRPVEALARPGMEELAQDYGLAMERAPVAPVTPRVAPVAPVEMLAQPSVEELSYGSPATRPLAAPPATTTPVSPAATDLMSLLQKYTTEDSVYGPELRAARTRANAETEAFQKMIAEALKQETAPMDKAEMYFRLAAAFGTPTKTGHFAESLGVVGKELGEMKKEERTTKRAERQARLQLGLEAQKLKTTAAKEELGTLRSLAAEEMKDKRAILTEYLKSGRPQSEAGKMAEDAGLTRGTPEYTAFVNKYIEDKISSGNAYREANLLIQQGNLGIQQALLALRQSAEERQKESSKKLTPAEVTLRAKTEDTLDTIESALQDLDRAFNLNTNSFDTTLKDTAVRIAMQETGSKDPRVQNTRELENLLKSAMISSASQKLSGVLSDSDIKLLQSVAGLDAKSKSEREEILKNAARALVRARTSQRRRLEDIKAGAYRDTTPAASGGD